MFQLDIQLRGPVCKATCSEIIGNELSMVLHVLRISFW